MVSHTFECVTCGDIDVSLVHHDTNGTEAICTLCGNVTTECPWVSSHDSSEGNDYTLNVPPMIRKVVNDLGLEPENVWCRRVMESVTSKVFTAKRVCSAIASQFEADGRSLSALLEYTNVVHGIAHDKVLDSATCSYNNRDVYVPLISRLSELVSMGPSTRRTLHKRVIDIVWKVPELEFKLPNSVVVAVWLKYVGAQGGDSVCSLCDWMHIKLPTIKRILPLM